MKSVIGALPQPPDVVVVDKVTPMWSERGSELKEAVHILAEGIPAGMTATAIADSMRKVPGVSQVHDLHVWTVAPGYISLSAHVTVDDQSLSQTSEVMSALKETLHQGFEIQHTTIQFECGNCGQGMVACLELAEVSEN